MFKDVRLKHKFATSASAYSSLFTIYVQYLIYDRWYYLIVLIVTIGDENSNKCGDYAPSFRKYQGKTFIIFHMRVKHNIRKVEPLINFVNDLESFIL